MRRQERSGRKPNAGHGRCHGGQLAGALLCVALAAATSGTAIGAPSAGAAARVLQDYLDAAVAEHPALRAAAAEAGSRRQAARAAGALPDLKLSWGEMVVPVETRVGPQRRVISASQSFPWFGTLTLKERVAAAEADAAQAMLERQRVAVMRNVRDAWYGLGLLAEEISIVTRNLVVARQTEAAVRAAYEAGEARYESVLSAQIELGSLQARLTGLHDRRTALAADLNVAAGLAPELAPPEATLPPAAALGDTLPPRSVLADSLVRRNPELAAAHRREDARRAALSLTGKAAAPDLSVGLDYIVVGEGRDPAVENNGRDPVVVRLGVSVPLWGGRVAAEKREAAGRLLAAGAAAENLEQILLGQLEDTLYRWRDAGRDLELYGTSLLPRARQNLDVVAAGYESGRNPFPDLMNAQRQLLGMELAAASARAERARAYNDLAALIGLPLAELAPSLAASERGRE